MTKQVAAKPQGFVLKMRLVAPDGTPFFRKWYRVKWGEKLIPPQSQPPFQTDSNGGVSVLLDAPRATAPQGILYVIERSDNAEAICWNIPLQLVDEPPLVTIPGIDVAPTPPPPGATRDVMLRHEQDMVRYRAQTLVQIREHIYEFDEMLNAVRDLLTVQPYPPRPTTPDDDLWEMWLAFEEAFTVLVHGYEAAWRLWNLCELPLAQEPTLPFLSSDFEMLLRSLDRFAFRRDLARPMPRPPSPAEVSACLEKLREIHDRRGSVA